MFFFPKGSWLELDDLKYPKSITHKRFTLRAREIHVVFWEAEPRQDVTSEICPPTNIDEHPSDSAADDPCVVSAMTVSEDADGAAASTMNASIGNTTLLDTFEGLSHADIVTLTLVEENAVTKVTHAPVPQSPAIVPPVVPSLPVAIARNPVGLQNASLLQRHPCFQSTPVRPPVPKPKPILRCENNETHPAKPADTFNGFLTKKVTTLPNPAGNPSTGGKASEILKLAGKKTPSLSSDNHLNTTEALRMKLMKKLKAKKKKLAKLNQLLGNGGETAPKPDSTALSSPYSVTSSTSAYDSTAYDQFFADLLSPATTVSNLSPDSTGLQEMLNNTQNGEMTNGSSQSAAIIPNVVPEQTLSYPSSTDDPVINLEDFIQSEMGQTAIDNTDFNALDLFF